MRIRDLGLIDYAQAAAIQAEAAEALRLGGAECLFLLEHPPVITFGRNGGEEHLPMPRAFFEARGVTLARSTRGGSITCHFPGQLVAYPVMRVDTRPGGLKRFFADLEETAIRTLARFGLEAERRNGLPGVWVETRKIASIGIAVKKWITSHGLAMNVAEDLSLFETVTPCGLPGVSATSLLRERPDCGADMAKVKSAFAEEFASLFSREKAT